MILEVVRAGLTSKPKDVAVLLEMLTYQMGDPDIVPARQIDKFTVEYNNFRSMYYLIRNTCIQFHHFDSFMKMPDFDRLDKI